jgi:hypothetical protein
MTITHKSYMKSGRVVCTFIAMEILEDDSHGNLEHDIRRQKDA